MKAKTFYISFSWRKGEDDGAELRQDHPGERGALEMAGRGHH